MNSGSKPSSNINVDDDLFSMLDNKGKGSNNKGGIDFNAASGFNIDDYIAKQQSSSGGLFD